MVERAPLAARRARLVPLRPARPLRARRRPALAARPRGGEARPVSSRPSATRSAASSCACVELVYAADEALRLIAEYEEPDAPAVEVEPQGGRRLRLHRGAARHPLPPLRARRRGHDPRRQDRAADVAEPADDRGGPARRRRALARRSRRGACAPLRADDPQLRPVHLVRDPLPEARGRASLRVVCVGNRWRSDDAAGLEVARRLEGTLPPRVELVEREGEPTALIDAWEGADALWLVDAVSSGAEAGTVHRLDASEHELPAELFRALDPPRRARRGGRARARARAAARADRRLRHRGRQLRGRRRAQPRGRGGRRAGRGRRSRGGGRMHEKSRDGRSDAEIELRAAPKAPAG